MKEKKYNIVVRGGYGFENFGDDALMYVIHQKLIEFVSEKQIAYLCNDSHYLEKIVNSSDVIGFEKLDDIKISSNLLLYGGGTQFYAFKKESLLTKFKRNLTHPKVLIKLMVNKLNYILKYNKKTDNKYIIRNLFKKTAAISVGVGPFLSDSDDVENNTKKLFKKMDFVAIRDIFSEIKCKEWGLTSFNKYPDACYSFDLEILNKNKPERVNKVYNKVGVIVRDWNHTSKERQYYKELIRAVKNLRDDDFYVKFIVFASSDIEWIDNLKHNKEDFLFWNPYKESIDEFIKQLNGFDVFITARFHGAVFSSLLGKPFISISVEQKLKMIHQEFKDGSLLWSYPFNKEEIMNNVKQICGHYIEYENAVIKEKKRKNKESDKMFTDFKKFYLNEVIN